jgi:hypothetical protein
LIERALDRFDGEFDTLTAIASYPSNSNGLGRANNNLVSCEA